MKRPRPRTTNRWALSALLERHPDFPTVSAFATEVETRHSTVFDVISGRRDASGQLLEAMADALDVPVEALSTDPYGVLPPLLKLAAAARRLAPDLNGHDFGLRAALAEVEEAGL